MQVNAPKPQQVSPARFCSKSQEVSSTRTKVAQVATLKILGNDWQVEPCSLFFSMGFRESESCTKAMTVSQSW